MCRTSIHGSWPAQVHTPGNPPNKPFFFVGTIRFALWKRIWKSWVPLRCKFFLWLALLNHCCTADRLPKWGLLHRTSLPSLWLGGEKNMQHLPISSGGVTLQCVGFLSWLQFLTLADSQDDGVDPSNRLTNNSGKIWTLRSFLPLGKFGNIARLHLQLGAPNANLVVRVVGERHQGKHNNVVCGWCKASLWASPDFLYSFCGVFYRLGHCPLFYWHANYVQWGDVVWGL